jgi:glycosyltransferase involved in cell wall biosynthesis
MARVSVIIPVFNEERTIEEVVRRVRATGAVHEIVAVDDGSRDRSPEILDALAADDAEPPLVAVRHSVNRGKGAAVLTALSHVTGDVVIVQDADLELDPAEFTKLFGPLHADRADVVFGVRFAHGPGLTPPLSYFGNKCFSWLASLLFLRALNDVLTGYRAMRTDVARRLGITSYGFGMDAEQGCRAIRAGCRIAQVPVTYVPRTVDQGKKLRFSSAVTVLAAILRVRFGG